MSCTFLVDEPESPSNGTVSNTGSRRNECYKSNPSIYIHLLKRTPKLTLLPEEPDIE